MPFDAIAIGRARHHPWPIIVLNAATHHHHTQTSLPNNTPSADKTTIALPADHTTPLRPMGIPTTPPP
ncbi:hypothetical protein PtB15_13B347 [Puccinia triticina]|nr:hypothetical protein PtB15_13B347 [Puccinia triticina]